LRRGEANAGFAEGRIGQLPLLHAIVVAICVVCFSSADIRIAGAESSTAAATAGPVSAPVSVSVSAPTTTSAYAIHGQVRDHLTRKPLPQARVIVDEANQVSPVDSLGRFRIDLAAPGVYRIRAVAPGYEGTSWRAIRLRPGAPTAGVILDCDPQTYRVPTVEIYGDRMRGDRYRADRAQTPSRILLASEIRRAPGGFQDPLRALQESRSIESRNDVGTLLTVRGGETDQILFLMDGFDIYNPYRMRVVLGGGLSLANPDLIESVELYAGGYSARFGNRASGVIQMKTREGNRLAFRSRHTLSLISASSAFEGPIAGGRGSWIAGFRRTYYDLIIHPPKGEGTQYPYLQEAQARFDYDLTSTQKIVVRGSIGDEGMDLLLRGDQQEDEDVQADGSSLTGSGSIEHSARLTGAIRAVTKVSLLGDRSRLHMLGVDAQTLYADARTTERRFSASHEWEISSPPHVTRIGGTIDRYLSQVAWHADSDPSPSVNPTPDSLRVDNRLSYSAVWIENVASLRENWVFSSGVRFEDTNGRSPIQASPRVALRGTLPLHHRFLIGAGQFIQYADGIECFSREAPLAIQSLAALPPERASLGSVGIDGGWRRVRWQVETYYRDTRDLHVPLDRTTYRAAAVGHAIASGIEVEVGLRSISRNERGGAWHEGWEISIAHAYSKSRFRGGVFDRWTAVSAERTHSFLAHLQFPLPAKMQVSTILRLGSGAPYTRLLGRIRSWDESGQEYFSGVWGSPFAERTSLYSRIDTRLDRDITLFGRRGTAFVEVMNLTNRRNTLSIQWDGDLLERRPVRGLPMIPYVGLSVWN
jgi:hypothetical protein